jgi:hypothetical protein
MAYRVKQSLIVVFLFIFLAFFSLVPASVLARRIQIPDFYYHNKEGIFVEELILIGIEDLLFEVNMFLKGHEIKSETKKHLILKINELNRGSSNIHIELPRRWLSRKGGVEIFWLNINDIRLGFHSIKDGGILDFSLAGLAYDPEEESNCSFGILAEDAERFKYFISGFKASDNAILSFYSREDHDSRSVGTLKERLEFLRSLGCEIAPIISEPGFLDAIVHVASEDRINFSDKYYGGTGFICLEDDSYYYGITSAHIIKRSTPPEVKPKLDIIISNNIIIEAEIVASSFNPDLSDDMLIFRIKKEGIDITPLRLRVDYENHPAVIFGYRSLDGNTDFQFNFNVASVGSLPVMHAIGEDLFSILEYSGEDLHGYSGGPIVDLKTGEVLGILNRVHFGDNLAGTPASRIINFLRSKGI